MINIELKIETRNYFTKIFRRRQAKAMARGQL